MWFLATKTDKIAIAGKRTILCIPRKTQNIVKYPETVNTQFLLYTRKNPLDPQLLDYRKPETILNSNIDPAKPLKFITHGFGGKNLTWVWQMKSAFLKMHDVNVIVVDWRLGARAPYYIQAAANTKLVGAEIAVLYFLIKDKLGIQEKDLHLIGFSLGAHVVGFAGKRMKQMRGTRPARATGLDPASPLFEDYGGEVHLFKDDADLVDVVHTNVDLLGMRKPIGHVDFYPNGGKRQPGCRSPLTEALKDLIKNDRKKTCHHARAVHLFTDSILNTVGCRYIGCRCKNYKDFCKAKCMPCQGEDCGLMGYEVKGTGKYYLMTGAKQPFCRNLAKLTHHFAKDVEKSYGQIILTLVGPNGNKKNATLTEKDEELLPGASRAVAITLRDKMMPLKSVDALYLKFNGWITTGKKTFGLDSVDIHDATGKSLFESCKGTVILKDNTYTTLSSC